MIVMAPTGMQSLRNSPTRRSHPPPRGQEQVARHHHQVMRQPLPNGRRVVKSTPQIADRQCDTVPATHAVRGAYLPRSSRSFSYLGMEAWPAP